MAAAAAAGVAAATGEIGAALGSKLAATQVTAETAAAPDTKPGAIPAQKPAIGIEAATPARGPAAEVAVVLEAMLEVTPASGEAKHPSPSLTLPSSRRLRLRNTFPTGSGRVTVYAGLDDGGDSHPDGLLADHLVRLLAESGWPSRRPSTPTSYSRCDF